MDIRKIAGLWGVALVLILTACSRAPSPPPAYWPVPPPISLGAPPNSLVHDPQILERATTILLVRVVELETVNDARGWQGQIATMLVLKSWKGPFSAGRVLHTAEGPNTCNGTLDSCDLYPFQVKDKEKEFLIMEGPMAPLMAGLGDITELDRTNVLFVRRALVWPAAESQALMAALDQAVIDSMPTDKEGYVARLQKELAASAYVRTKLLAAESNRAPDDEIADLYNQLLGHRENAARSQRVLRQLVGGDCERWLDALLGPSAWPLDVACAHACLEPTLNSPQCRADRLFGSRRAPERLKEVNERGVP